MDSDPWHASNARRLELVEKLFDSGGLSPTEYAELHELQMQAGVRFRDVPRGPLNLKTPSPWTRPKLHDSPFPRGT